MSHLPKLQLNKWCLIHVPDSPSGSHRPAHAGPAAATQPGHQPSRASGATQPLGHNPSTMDGHPWTTPLQDEPVFGLTPGPRPCPAQLSATRQGVRAAGRAGSGQGWPGCSGSRTTSPPSHRPHRGAPTQRRPRTPSPGAPHLPPLAALSEHRGPRRGARLLPGTLGTPRRQRGAGHQLHIAGKAWRAEGHPEESAESSGR